MKKIFGSPSRYIQGAGVMQDLSAYAEVLGSKPAIIIDPEVNELIGDMVKGSFQQKDKPCYLEILGEESPPSAVTRPSTSSGRRPTRQTAT